MLLYPNLFFFSIDFLKVFELKQNFVGVRNNADIFVFLQMPEILACIFLELLSKPETGAQEKKMPKINLARQSILIKGFLSKSF